MTFLNSAFLWMLPFISIPVLLHFLNKQKPKRLLFSYIDLIKQADQSLMPKKRLRDLLLMILRTLMLLFLILFFSRPVLDHGAILSGEDESSTIILLMDVSASMGLMTGGRPTLAVAKEQVQSLLRKFTKETRIGFVAYSDRVEAELAPTKERSRLATTIGGLSVQPRPTNAESGLALAYQMLANQPASRKSLLVISDHAQNGWMASKLKNQKMEGYDPEVAVIIWEVSDKIKNHGVSEASLQLSEEGVLKGNWILNQKTGRAGSSNWQLELNKRIVGQGTLDSRTAHGSLIPLQAQLPDGGFFSGQIKLTQDALPFDDVYYVAGRLPKGFRLLVVDGEGGLAPSDAETYYLRSALESPRDPRLKEMRVIRPEVLSQEPLGEYDVIVLANTQGLEDLTEPLIDFVEQGGGLLLTAGQNWPKAPATPLGLFQSKSPIKNNVPLEIPEKWPESLSAIAEIKSFEWNQIRVDRVRPLQVSRSEDVLLSLKDETPVLIRKKIGKGSILCLTTTVDRSWTNLPAKPIFSPLMRELIASLADPLREQTTLNGFVDQPFRVQIPAGLRNVTVVAPNGTSAGARVDKSGYLEWLAPSEPGLYQVRTNDPDKNFSFAINIRELDEEGDLTRIAESELKSLFPEAPFQMVRAGSGNRNSVLAALQGKDLTTILLVFLFIFFFIESILSWTKTRQAAMVFLCVFLVPSVMFSGFGNNFVYAQLKYKGQWDPYPQVHEDVLAMVTQMTNIPIHSKRVVVTLTDKKLFELPFLLVKGNSKLALSETEKQKMKQYIDRGGMVFFDDTMGEVNGPFGRSVRSLMEELYPSNSFQKMPQDHAMYRAFFLLRNIAGRRISSRFLEGMDVGGQGGGEGRTAVIFSPNDLLGAWIKDRVGQYVYSCEPGGESQRWESFKLTLNLIYFSLTGTYKKDAVHQPFIERKLEN